MTPPLSTAAAARRATAVALLLTAHHVAARAVRDALFLTTFDARFLPAITAIGAVVSLVIALLGAGWVRRLGPSRVAPPALWASALLLVGIWGLSFIQRPAAAVLLYVHVAAGGGLLLSLFWSVLNERFDPNALRRHVGRIGAGASIGGLVGGGGAFAASAAMHSSSLLPALAATQVLAGILLRPLGVARVSASFEAPPAEGRLTPRGAIASIRGSSMLRHLALLVAVCATGSALLDYLFKSSLQGVVPAEAGLIRVFALFHGTGALLTVFAQSFLLRLTLDRAGVGRTVAALPGALAGGAAVGLFVPGAGAYATTWLFENVLRGSFFRSGYEMAFTPLPPSLKRGAKSLVDIGASRLGDITGAAIAAVCLALFGAGANTGMLLAIIVLGAVGVAAAVRLDREYRVALETGLRARASEAELPAGDEDPYTRTMVLDTVTLRRVREFANLSAPAAAGAFPARVQEIPAAGAESPAPPKLPEPTPPARPAPEEVPVDPLSLTQVLPRFTLEELAGGSEVEILRSDDIERIRRALAARWFSPVAVPLLVEWLADDRVAREAAVAIHRALPGNPDILAAALLDRTQPLAARRRLPRLLRTSTDPAVTRALADALSDERFDVRAAAARALARMHAERGAIAVERERVFAAVEREIAAGRPFWESKPSLSDPLAEDADDASQFLEEFVRERSGRALEHVFTLLSLVLEREPLRLAYQALTAEDEALRGFALEYLEVELPQRVRERLRPFLGMPEGPSRRARSRDDALADLVRQNQTVRLRLDEIRKRLEGS